MNLKNFHQEISQIILQRGKDYYNEGAVISLEEKEHGLWNAYVEGTEVYLVEVQLDNSGEIDMFLCDCPHEENVCKHIAAVFYELKDRVKTIRLKPVEESETVGFEAILKNLTAAELKYFIAVYARDDKNFKRQFELYFANRD